MTIDRLFAGLFTLAVAISAAVVFLFSLGFLRLANTIPFGAQIERWLNFNQFPYGLGRVAVGAVSAIIGMSAVVLLLRRWNPSTPRRSSSHILVADDRGFVVVEKRGIATVAAAAALKVRGVVDADVDVSGAGAAPVRLLLKCWVHAGADLKRAGDEARLNAIQSVESLVGLEVKEAVVRLEVVPLEDLSRVE